MTSTGASNLEARSNIHRPTRPPRQHISHVDKMQALRISSHRPAEQKELETDGRASCHRSRWGRLLPKSGSSRRVALVLRLETTTILYSSTPGTPRILDLEIMGMVMLILARGMMVVDILASADLARDP